MNKKLSKETDFYRVNGIKFKVKELTSQQSNDNAQVAQLKREFAEHPSGGLSPAKLAAITLEAEHGNLMAQADLAEDMEEKDSHIYAELNKRKAALLTVDWSIVPPNDANDQEKKDAELVEQILRDGHFMEDVILDMADGILKGYSNLEIEWQHDGGHWLPKTIEHRPARWFMVHPEDQNELRLRDQSHNGAELRQFGWIKHQHKAKTGYVGRANLIRILAWPFLFKNYSVRDLAEFLEIYGLPARIGKYPTGAGDGEKASLLQAIMSIGHNAGGIIPKGMEIDFANAASGQADPFELMINWCERSQSKAILGGTLTSGADGKTSTNALGNVHNEGRIELRNSDCRQIANSLSEYLVQPIHLLNSTNISDKRRAPRFEFDVSEPEDLKLFSEALPNLVKMGMKIDVNYAHDKLQIPEAEDGADILTMADVKPLTNDEQPNKNKKPVDLKSAINQTITALKAIDDTDQVDQQSEQLAATLSPQLKTMVDDIEKLVNSADSLEALQASLLDLDLPIDDMAKVMQLALSSSQLMGQYDVSKGN